MSASAEDNGDDLNQEASVAGQQGREDDTSYCCVSEQVYVVESGNEKKVLYLMCIGLTYCSTNDNEDQPLFLLTEEPWSLLPKNSHVCPKNTEYILEITRRIDLFNIVPAEPCCPSNWTRIQKMEWLEHNPIREAADIEFLTNEVMRLRELLIRAQRQQGIDSGTAGQGGRNWRGIVPYLCVIMCLTQDNVKRLFLARADTRSRQELDARNSDTRPPTVFEVMSDLWNSDEFNPIAPASECYVDFLSAIDCSHEHVAGLLPATPQRIEDLMVSMRSDLLRIITRWEQSGQGEGGRDSQEQEEANDEGTSSCSDDDDDTRNIGVLTGRSPRALQSRASFLNGRPSYLLYFWEVADTQQQVLQSSLQRLNNKAGASDASRAPPVSSTSSTARSNHSGGSSLEAKKMQTP